MSARKFSGITTKEDPDSLFELMEHIGTGSYGEVFKARSLSTQDLMAIKIIKLEAGEELDEVLNEVNFLSECSHRNVVSYIGCYMKKGTVKGQKHVWIVMEFCGGGSVEAAYKGLRGPLLETEISAIIRESLLGLSFLHSCSKIHRDIKCGNILMTETGEIKIADFGVSTQLTRTFSKRHTFIGTPYWMAPEVITSEQQGTAYDYKADIWSLGITAMEMAECSPPMFDMHPMRVLFMIPKLDPPTLKDKAKWSPTFQDFLRVCLEKDPDKRPTADELLQVLHTFPIRKYKAGIRIPLGSPRFAEYQHPFMEPHPRTTSIITGLIERTREARRSRISKGLGDGSSDKQGDEEEDADAGAEEGDEQPETVRRAPPSIQTVPDSGSSAELSGASQPSSTPSTDQLHIKSPAENKEIRKPSE
ncbi:hypothetical protein HK104_004433 [Borealophlyctis nickersoniae]|nr:hypothetical protein HK104_004433 [Borealophlyctis nickersoniae]